MMRKNILNFHPHVIQTFSGRKSSSVVMSTDIYSQRFNFTPFPAIGRIYKLQTVSYMNLQ